MEAFCWLARCSFIIFIGTSYAARAAQISKKQERWDAIEALVKALPPKNVFIQHNDLGPAIDNPFFNLSTCRYDSRAMDVIDMLIDIFTTGIALGPQRFSYIENEVGKIPDISPYQRFLLFLAATTEDNSHKAIMNLNKNSCRKIIEYIDTKLGYERSVVLDWIKKARGP